MHVAIVGAGMSGLVAARALSAAGISVSVYDKGRSVGGRLATRRIGDGRADHGAQFFTVRSAEFGSLVETLVAEGVVEVWTHGFDADDGHPRYRVVAGMNMLAKRLAADLPVDAVHTDVRIETVADDRLASADRVVITSPVPQTIDLLDAADLPVPDALRAITYDPTLCLLARLDGPADLGPTGARQRPEGTPVEFVVDNATKGISAAPVLTMHLTGPASAERFDRADDVILAELLDIAQPFLGRARAIDASLKRWRYATPTVLHPDACLVDGRFVYAGDAFGTAKVEGAFLSGLAAARAIRAS